MKNGFDKDAFRKAQLERGLVDINVWVHKKKIEEFKAMVARLNHEAKMELMKNEIK